MRGYRAGWKYFWRAWNGDLLFFLGFWTAVMVVDVAGRFLHEWTR